MAEVCPTALWKTELGSDERGYLAEELSRQSVDRVAWFILLTVKYKRRERKSGRNC